MINLMVLKRGSSSPFPSIVDEKGNISVVRDLPLDDWIREKLKVTEAELLEERKIAFEVTNTT